ncbi:MAG: hypothetical protein KAW12_29045 [Candidatus Aminicenantes bacterium]|nr:hypothetical protein [Candidatus Aminicenantes bacterium]
MEKLSGKDLINLIRSVFPPFSGDKKLGILVDVPVDMDKDNSDWKLRRQITEGWFHAVRHNAHNLALEEIQLLAYPDVGSNNADLPAAAYKIREKLPVSAELLCEEGEKISFEQVFKEFQLFLAPTEYSTTAPLKVAARKFGFRAATMPGFSPKMIPALRIDYNEVARRVKILKEKLDPAEWADVAFQVEDREYKVFFDLRHRPAHLSPGRFPDAGVAGNLPSGETYIVPYEGEKSEKSKTEGTLPVQIGEDVLFFDIRENRAVKVAGKAVPALEEEQDHLRREPAYGNMAELGFGVLGDFGLKPIKEILLDEKLGFHIAFGRSDHFGGIVSPADFSSPKEVIHLDRIYIPATQPLVQVRSILLGYEDSSQEEIFKDGEYLIF